MIIGNSSNIGSIPLPKVTVGIVAYNTPESTLEKTFSSLRASNLDLYIVVFCNSILDQYQKKIQILCNNYKVDFRGNQPNKGFGHGHNQIASLCKSEWYICCNPDVVVNSSTIATLLAFGEQNGDSVLLMPRILSPDGTVQPVARQTLTPKAWVQRQLWRLMPKIFSLPERRFDYNKSQPVDFVSGSFFAVKLEIFLALNGFDESFFLYAEDADLSYRAKSIGENYFVATAEITHYWTTANHRNLRTIRIELYSLFRYFKKHRLWTSF